MTCAPREDSDDPGHHPSLIRVIAVHMKKPWALIYLLSVSEDSDQTRPDAQADLSLCWAHMSFCWFCRTVAHLSFGEVNQQL